MRLSKYIGIILLTTTGGFANTAVVSFTNLPYTTGENTYTGWAIATINDSATGQLLMCDDYFAETYMPHADMVYDFSVLGNDLNISLGGLEFGSQANAAQDYQAAAYLSWKYFEAGYDNPTGTPGPTVAQNQAATDYNFAIWNLFDPAVLLSAAQTAYQTNALAFVGDPANSAFLTALYSDTRIYTPDPNLSSAGNQEFIQLTPEPGTVGMVIAGATLVLLSRKIRTKRG